MTTVAAPTISIEVGHYGPRDQGWSLTVEIDRQRVLEAHFTTTDELAAQLDLTLAQLARRISTHVARV